MKRRDIPSREGFGSHAAVGVPKFGKGYSMAYGRSRLDHRPDILRIEQVKQLADGERLPTLGFFGRRVGAKSHRGENVGGGFAGLIGR